MRTRSIVPVALSALLAAGAVAAGADAEPRKRTACERLAGEDLAPPRRLKVVKREGRDGSVRLLACTLRGGKVRTISSYVPDGEHASGDIDVEAAGDRHVLLTESSRERGSGEELVRIDTRTRRRHSIAWRSCDPDRYCTGATISGAVMHRTGPVAALLTELPPCCGPATGPTPPTKLVRVAVDGTRTVLDEGTGLAGVRRDGDEVVWTRDGAEQRAPLR